jgi:hypothetical protein
VSDDREGAGGRQASDGDSGRGKVEGVAGRGRRKLAAAGVTVAAGLGLSRRLEPFVSSFLKA